MLLKIKGRGKSKSPVFYESTEFVQEHAGLI